MIFIQTTSGAARQGISSARTTTTAPLARQLLFAKWNTYSKWSDLTGGMLPAISFPVATVYPSFKGDIQGPDTGENLFHLATQSEYNQRAAWVLLGTGGNCTSCPAAGHD